MNKAALILDPAHGVDVAGKQSPDGAFEEWRFSRMLIRKILGFFPVHARYPFDVKAPFLSYDTEPGLYNRVNVYNAMSEDYNDTVMLSLHVDAFKAPLWWDGTGFSFFTSREHNMSDQLANVIVKAWEREMTNERIRHSGPGDVSKDKNFTVLYGYNGIRAKYHGILIENGFMDSEIDILKLSDPVWIDRLAKTYYIAILYIFNYLDYYTLIPETTVKA